MVSEINMPENPNIKMIDDFILPFQIDKADIVGRVIRSQKSISRILTRHNYDKPVAQLLGEALLLVTLLGSGMKLKHRIILQIKGDGALPMLVADYYADGSLRGYVECDDALYKKWTGGDSVNPFLLIGKGHLAITIDHGDNTRPYQGIVPLEGESLANAVLAYIEGSDQILSSLKLIIQQKDYNGIKQWYGAAMLIQKLGTSGEALKGDDNNPEKDEKWTHIKALFHTLSDDELLDNDLPVDRLLFRLFHEDGVRVFDEKDIKFDCKCDKERLEAVLKHSKKEDLKEMADENGMLEVDCQFCQNKYQFFLKDL
ncbi:MAG: molecular chaperone Hsp33 [Alphaproteobacteria bacterium]|jgi:molecular chaperone Hsp33